MTVTMSRQPTEAEHRRRRPAMTTDELGKTLSEMIADLQDIAAELKSLSADRHIPASISPLVTQGLRNTGWAADHLSNAQLVLQATAMQQAGEG
jgi:hypothetical protein